MSVIFISPKQRQKVFFLIIVAMFLLFVSAVFLGVFLSKPSKGTSMVAFDNPKVEVSMNIFDSDQLKNMQPVNPMQKEFSYTIVTKDGKQRTGFMSAQSAEDVKKYLEAQKYRVGAIIELEIGRDNPFSPYYTITIPPIKRR